MPSHETRSSSRSETLDTKVWRDSAGRAHRDDGPAVVYPDGGTVWYRHGVLHRDDGPAVVYPDGGTEWYRHGVLHRVDGPAVEYDSADGGAVREWWLFGIPLEPLEHGRLAARLSPETVELCWGLLDGWTGSLVELVGAAELLLEGGGEPAVPL